MMRPLLYFLPFLVFGLLFATLPVQSDAHLEVDAPREIAHSFLSGDENTTPHFLTASRCEGCHGFDQQGHASLDLAGNDVNVQDDWEASMMANAAKDPFWKAKITHELLAIPGHSEEIQTKCTSCHAPMGHYQALFEGATHYTLADLALDTLGQDGVSCVACHALSDEQLGLEFSGVLRYDTNHVLYGPYETPFGAPMLQYVGFDPLYSPHVNDAGLCAGCHTLITESFDLEGNPTGETFVEQATYHEWLNSEYEATDVSCQSCHMPRIPDPVVISSGYLFLEGRTPFGLHDLAGANTAMLELLKENRDALGVVASEEDFDESIAKTLHLLQDQSADVELHYLDDLNDTLYLQLSIENLAGHKFPSGYPSRRLVASLWVVTSLGDTLFHSGKMNDDFSLPQEDWPFEPHHATIRDEGQVQIYEFVAGDVEGSFNTVLEQGTMVLKDNRLPPAGFTTAHPAYDTTQISGLALSDPDFNRLQGVEGSGTDQIEYRVALNGYEGQITVGARLYYQSLPPKWMGPILEESTPEIDTFRQMFEATANDPVLVAERWLNELTVDGGPSATTEAYLAAPAFRIFPNPTSDGRVQVQPGESSQRLIKGVTLWDLNGRELARWETLPTQLTLPRAGIYWIRIHTDRGVWTSRVIFPPD